MARYETYERNGVTWERDNGPSGPHDMTVKEIYEVLRGIRPNNAVQMDFKDMLATYGGVLTEARKRKLHLSGGELFSEGEQWRSFVEKETGEKIGYIELFEAGIEVLNHPEHARVIVTVDDIVKAGRKALADKLAEASDVAEDRGNQSSDRNEKGQFTKCDKTENVTIGSDRGNSATYRLGRIKRDHPELAARIMAGEFKSVSEAERAAGLRPPKATDLEKFQRAYFRLSIADQAAAKGWMESL